MNTKKLLIWSIFLVCNGLVESSYSFDFYLGDDVRYVDVFSKSPTLMMFPSVVIASSCQPEGRVDFFKVDEVGDLYDSSADLNTLSELKNSRMDLFLKLVPSQISGEVSCSFSLQNGAAIHLGFRLKENIYRPLLKIKEYQTSVCLQEGRNVQSLFIDLIQGRPQQLIEVTPAEHLTRSDPHGRYKITYVGRKGDVKGVLLELMVDGVQKIPQRLQNVEVGEVYYSVFLKEKKNIYQTEKIEKIQVILLVRADLSTEEILNKLPVIGETNEK